MPIYRLTKKLEFPPPHLAEEGLLAFGGDLSAERLLLAYRSGIFPWFNAGEPILWWSPDPRAVFEPGSFRAPRRLLRKLRQGRLRVTADTAFAQVIRHCAHTPRPGQRGTWITREMRGAYIRLHELGYAHSFETWSGEALVGGMYGVSVGGMFFGESMFSHETDASKAALTMAMAQFRAWGFELFDAQVMNPHLRQLGAAELPREEFLKRLERGLRGETRRGRWTLRVEIPGGDGAVEKTFDS